MKKMIIIVTVLFIIILFSCRNDGKCPEGANEYYKTYEMYIKMNNIKNKILCEEKPVLLPLENGEITKYSKFGINILFKIELVKGHYYCGDFLFVDSIKQLIITSNNDYNQQYKKGDTLNNIIELKYDYNGQQLQCPISLSDYIKNKPECNSNMLLFFTIPPDSTRQHKFKIYYEESCGTIYQKELPPVYLQP